MDIERKGGNCIVISSKKYTFVTDPNLSPYGLKNQGAGATAEILTHADAGVPTSDATVVIEGPGEYEVHNCTIVGIAARPHSQAEDTPKSATIYRLDFEDITVAVIGHVNAHLKEDDLEAIGVVDVLVLPVGGNGYTLEPKEAVQMVRTIEPKLVIPTHYQEEGVSFEMPQAPLSDFIKELGATHEQTAKLKLKSGALPETLTVYEITRTK